MDHVTAVEHAVRQAVDAGDAPVLAGVDGRAGSGKSTTAAALTDRLRAEGLRVVLVPMDELYDGWHGLQDGVRLLAERVLAPLRRGVVAEQPCYDWHLGRYGAPRPLPRADVVLVEGVGSTAVPGPLLDVRVWLELPAPVRRERALRRDGEMFAPHWRTWAAQEDQLLAAHRVNDRTHLVLTPGDH